MIDRHSQQKVLQNSNFSLRSKKTYFKRLTTFFLGQNELLCKVEINLLEHSDRSVHAALQAFSAMGAEVGLFSPTANGLDKSIFDSHENLCSFFKRYKIHDYYKQIKGTDHKRLLDISILTPKGIKLSQITFYRPNTKNGDPRFWVRGIKESANPKNLLGIFIVNSVLSVVSG